MKVLGAFLISLCPVLLGFKNSKDLKQNQIKIEKIIELINYIIIEIQYKKTDIYSMFYNFCYYENFKNLEFLKNLKESLKKSSFPIAWENSIEEWDNFNLKEEKNLLKSMSNILGATDSKSQIENLNYVKMQFKERLKLAKKAYYSKGKISRSLGTFLGIAIFIVFI